MVDYLFRKLSAVAELDEDDRRAIKQVSKRAKQFEPKQEVIGHGERPEFLHLMVEGWAARYKTLRGGTRQIVGFLIPGDFCDLHVQILGAMDHNIIAMSRCKVAFIPASEFAKLTEPRTRLTRALWWTTLVDEAVLREWVLNAGRREAYEAAAHLLSEMHVRMDIVGLVQDGRIEMPLTQEELGDALGITPVHTNRILQRLRKEGLITFKRGMLTIHDVDALHEVGGFDPEYLHIGKPRAAASSTSAFHF